MEKDDLKVSLEPEAEPQTESNYQDPSPTDRVVATVASPTLAYNGLLRARNLGSVIGVSLVIGIVTLFASFLLVSQTDVYAEQVAEQTERAIERIQESGQFSGAELAEFEKAMEGNSDQSPTLMLILFFFAVPVITAIVSLAVLVLSKILEKSSESYIRFMHAFSVTALAIVPFGLLSLVLGLIQFTLEINVANFGLSGLVGQDNLSVYMMATVFTIPPLAYIASLALGTRSIARSGLVAPVVVLLILTLVAYGLLGFLQELAFSMAG